MSRAELEEAFTATSRHLDELGIEDGFVRDLITSRLVIERVGEVEQVGGQGWWDSRVLSETGRDRLTDVTPRTWVQARIDLAMEVGQKAESDRLPTDTVSLFSMSPQIESRVAAAIDDIPPDEEVTFSELEELEIDITAGWTDPLIETIGTEADTDLFEDVRIERTGVFKLQVQKDDELKTEEGTLKPDDVENGQYRILAMLLAGYGYNHPNADVGELQIPYYGLTADIEESVF